MFRLFKRIFKRADIALAYSQGFNPHPKMSICQPLSLGYSSRAELLEFECVKDYNTEEILQGLRSHAPSGLSIYSCESIPEGMKAPSSTIKEAEWRIELPYAAESINEESIAGFLSQEKIEVEKFSRKSGKTKTVDIKPMILSLSLSEGSEAACTVKARLSAGSESNLSPELMINALLSFAGLEADRSEIEVERLKLIYR